MQQIWLVTAPVGKADKATILKTIKNSTQENRVYNFNIPELTVGTLDSLMALSDDLTKINNQVEVIIYVQMT